MYDLQFILTEESFHQSGLGGYWAGAMGCTTVAFSIPDTTLAPVIVSLLPDIEGDRLQLRWTGISGAGYNVYRDTIPGFTPAVPLAAGLSETTYVDSAPGIVGDADVNYYYAVTAVREGKESAPSARAGEFDKELREF
jgi:hypothetical protein